MSSKHSAALSSCLLAIGCLAPCAALEAADRLPDQTPRAEEPSRVSTYRPVTPEPLPIAPQHPLKPVLDYARKEQLYLEQMVHDFTCRLVKRERIDDELQDYQYIDMRLREEIRSGDRVVKPLAIFLHFLGPAEVLGRKVLYVAGQNEDKMLVRNGGKRFKYVIVKLDPDGKSAHRQSLVPITQSGFKQVLSHMIQILEADAQLDPDGANSTARRISGAKIDHRPCTVIRVTHPQKQQGLKFHVANVFVDDELHVPVRVDYSDWPEHPGEPPALTAEYTYTQLQLNVHLTDADFSSSQLRVER